MTCPSCDGTGEMAVGGNPGNPSPLASAGFGQVPEPPDYIECPECEGE